MVASRLSTAAALAVRAAVAASAKPSLKEDLSGAFGSISLTAWICLLLPQLIQNYKSQSAEGLSMAFLFVWLLGDVTNLSGALCTGLAPTAVALAAYFCVADIVLISQCMYYNAKTARRELALRQGRSRRRSSSTAVAGAPADDSSEGVFEGDDAEDDSPLLARRRSSSMGLPGSHRRRSTHRSESHLDPLRRIITGEDETPDSNPWLHNALSLVAVWVVGALGYFASTRMGAWEAPDAPGDGPSDDPTLVVVAGDGYANIIGMALGYASAICYLCARIPQIIKNYREKSCEGLALLFFLLSLTGNLAYGASLVAYSQEGTYLVKALPWLLGSLGTIVEDMVIFFQFRLYSPQRQTTKSSGASPETSAPAVTYGTV